MYPRLRGKIVEVYRTQTVFAHEMGMNPSTLNGKLNGKSQWMASEIAKACRLLGVPLSEAHTYFFCEEGCKTATT